MSPNDPTRAAAPEVPAWHALPSENVLAKLEADREGLPGAEAEARLARYGPNRLSRPPGRGPITRFLLQFHNVLIYVLLAAGVTTALLGEWVETGVIFGVVLINAIVGFVQEGKAERALDAIREMLSPDAHVVREGRRMVVSAEDLVPGDIVLLQSGDKVPADLRLFQTKGLRVQEAALTGESVPVDKALAPVEPDAPLGERAPMAYAGTLVVHGQAQGVVVATGDATEIGRIGAMLSEVTTLETPLLRQMGTFARWLTAAILLVAALTFAFGTIVREAAPTEMFFAAVGIAVAAIPEGLPAVLTITLALGVQSMARRNAIIRRLPAVETLGAVTVICTDKTGTLTRNEMTLQRVLTADADFAASGIGYGPRGEFTQDGAAPLPEARATLQRALRGALLCNDADLVHTEGEWRVDGDPTEGALITAAQKAGLDPQEERRLWRRLDSIPFESEHRFMASLHESEPGGRRWIFVKGAPEVLLERCTDEEVDGVERPIEREAWRRRVDLLAAEGLRVLAIAAKPVDPDRRALDFEDVAGGMTLLCLCGLIDPPREEAIAAIRACQSAGIRVKMITGDHALTARAIGERIGLENPGAVLTGPELDAMDDASLRKVVDATDMFARTSPEHKLRLVEALQGRVQVIAMTGDGVNDAPALKRADIGIAMGRKGTEAAKEASEMVLADDNFATIAAAVEEGRKVYDNLKKAIVFILPTNAAEAAIIITAVLFGYVLPITAVQILWINMVTAVTLGLALAFEPPEPGLMGRPPRPADEPILSGFLGWRIVSVAAIVLLGTFGLFVWWRDGGASLAEARTVAVNTLVLFEVYYLLNCRFLIASSATREGLLGSRPVLLAIGVVVALQLAFTYAPPFQLLFESAPLGWAAWPWIVAVGAAVFAFVELEKLWRRRAAHAQPRGRRVPAEARGL